MSADWPVRKWIASTINLRAADETKPRVKSFSFRLFFGILKEINFCIYVVYTNTIIHLTVVESGGYSPRRLNNF